MALLFCVWMTSAETVTGPTVLSRVVYKVLIVVNAERESPLQGAASAASGGGPNITCVARYS